MGLLLIQSVRKFNWWEARFASIGCAGSNGLVYRGDGAVAGARVRAAAAERVHGVYAGAQRVPDV